jgi:hypothetical protein
MITAVQGPTGNTTSAAAIIGSSDTWEISEAACGEPAEPVSPPVGAGCSALTFKVSRFG